MLINRSDMARLVLEERTIVSLASAIDDGLSRVKPGLRLTPYDIRSDPWAPSTPIWR